MTYSAIASCATFLFLPHFDVICELLRNRQTTTWNIFVKLVYLNGNNVAEGENNIKYANSYPMN